MIWFWFLYTDYQMGGLDEMASDSYFNLNANPISNTELVSIDVGNLPNGQHRLQITDQSGGVVANYPVSQSNTTYSFEMNLTSGIYFLNLGTGQEVLQQEKIVVQ